MIFLEFYISMPEMILCCYISFYTYGASHRAFLTFHCTQKNLHHAIVVMVNFNWRFKFLIIKSFSKAFFYTDIFRNHSSLHNLSVYKFHIAGAVQKLFNYTCPTKFIIRRRHQKDFWNSVSGSTLFFHESWHVLRKNYLVKEVFEDFIKIQLIKLIS